MTLKLSYDEMKKKALETFFKRTNAPQREAIFHTEGAVLIIAGAGSGKTTVLCNRIANLLLFGKAYNVDFERDLPIEDIAFAEEFIKGGECDTDRLSELFSYERVMPWQILAVTFTNKAAGELKERLSNMGVNASEVWASTFHSCCVKFLRRGIERIGYKGNFTIYDTDDSLKVIKNIMKSFDISDKAFSPKLIQSRISRAKDKLKTPEDYSTFVDGKEDYIESTVKKIYMEYQRRLKTQNALDFDDIIMKTIELFEAAPDVLEKWQRQFRYIMVDEYQDTNFAQYRLVSMLAEKNKNLCVVGDEDQSIYKFRGATIENIQKFDAEFNATTIKLEQNYRSSANILNAANAVIRNNKNRNEKTLWSDLGEGEKLEVCLFNDEQAESMYVANTIMNRKEDGGDFSEHTVLYRTNAQSRIIELALSRMAIPYRIIGGTKFYDRKEIKDIIAYLNVIINPSDWVRLSRIINVPKRNIGDATQNEVERISLGLGIDPVEVMARAEEFQTLSKKMKPLVALADIFTELSRGVETGEREIANLIDDVLDLTGYRAMLEKEGEEGSIRLQNIAELKSAAITFSEENPNSTLFDYLENVALISDLDSFETSEDKVTLMTIHSAKGLEFDTVFLVGAEDNIFPSFRSIQSIEDLDEERRLAYVAITRAKRRFYITAVKERLLYGQTQRNRPSRFIAEIPDEYKTVNDNTEMLKPRKKPEKPPGYLQSQGQKKTIKPVIESKSAKPSFSVGDRVKHKIFGDGTIVETTPMGNDTLLEIAFDRIGTKKIMANFAKVEKID